MWTPRKLRDRFVTHEHLGTGRYGEVLRAFDRVQRRMVALKVLDGSGASGLVRLRAEFVRIARLRTVLHGSPHLVGYHRLLLPRGELAGEAADEPALLSMELVEGGRSLGRWLPPHVSPEARAAPLERVLPQLLEGLLTLHAAGLVHRDISLGNVLVVGAGEPLRAVLIDYGLSVLEVEPLPTRLGLGTYVAPEERREGRRRPSPAADLWCLGMTLCDALLGPATVPDEPPVPRIREAELRPRWKGWLSSMLVEDPERRPSAAQLLAELRGEAHVELGSRRGEDPVEPRARSPQGEPEGHRRFLRALRGESIETDVIRVTGGLGAGVSELVDRGIAACLESGSETHEPPLVLRAECPPGLLQSHGVVRALGDALMLHLRRLPRRERSPLPGARALCRIIEGLSLVDALFEPGADAGALEEEPELGAREAFRTLLVRLARDRRVVLVIEDAHRGDADSARLLAALLDPPVPGLVIVLAGASVVGPAPLYGLSERVVHPCTIELDPPAGFPTPPAQLASDERSSGLLRVAAIATLPLPASVLVEVAGGSVDDDSVRSAFELEDRGLLDASGPDDRLFLPEGSLRGALRAQLDPAQSRRLHARIAEQLLAEERSDPAAVFRHLVGAQRATDAIPHGVRAAELAAERLAHQAEVELRRQLVALPGGEEDWRRVRELGEALVRASATLESGEVLERAAGLARRADEPIAQVDHLLRLAGRQLMFAGELERGKQLFLRAAADLGIRAPRSGRLALGEAMLRRLLIVLGDALRRRRPRPRADPDPVVAQALWDAAMATSMIDYPTSDALAMRHLSAVRDTGLRSQWLQAVSREAASCANIGRWLHVRARRMERECAALGATSDDPLDEAWVLFAVRSAAWFRADWSTAADAARRAERVLRLRCTGVAWDIAVNDVFLSSALAMMGELGELRERIEVALRHAHARSDRYTSTSMRLGEPLLGYGQGNCRDALAMAREELGAWPFREIPGLLFPWIQTLVGCALHDGRAAEVREDLRDAWVAVRRTGLLRLECVGTILLHARGRWLLATGARRRAGIIAWRLGWSSLPMGRAMGAALRGGLAWGRAPERARGWMVEASEGFMACGMRTHAAACRHRALALAPGTEPAVEWPDGLESERVADALAPVAR